MKWFSVKKYTPLIGGEYFVTDGDFVYVAEFNPNCEWVHPSNGEQLGNISHFCKPDPIEHETGEF